MAFAALAVWKRYDIRTHTTAATRPDASPAPESLLEAERVRTIPRSRAGEERSAVSGGRIERPTDPIGPDRRRSSSSRRRSSGPRRPKIAESLTIRREVARCRNDEGGLSPRRLAGMQRQ